MDDIGKALGEDRSMSSTATPIPVGSDQYSRVVEWLYREAAMLDASDYSGWLELLAEDLVYEMPIRQSVYQKDGDGFRDDFGFFADDYGSMKTRVLRLKADGLKQCEQTAKPYSAKGGVAENATQMMVCE